MGTAAPDARKHERWGLFVLDRSGRRQADVTEMLERVNGTVPSPIVAYLESLLERHAADRRGDVATYIPELASTDPDLFGICLVTVDGAVYEAGDTRHPFTIQSMSKPLTYGLALELAGAEEVRRRVGVEPSGDPFNEISLSRATGRPVNPMINAGAITCAGLVLDHVDDPVGAVLRTYSSYAGRNLELDEAVYRSEADTGHRNRAIAHLLRSFGVLASEAEAAVDLYFRQCSVSVDCRDLAFIAATLAGGGTNPITGERAVRENVVRSVLSVMTTCGMYDGAGEWLVSVGIPAKSGVSGGVFGVLPGRLGIAVFSPRLDEQGNSVRGVGVCRDLSHDLALHLVRPGERSATPVRASYPVGARRSKRRRTDRELATLREFAGMTAVFELQGELGFVAAEAVSRSVAGRDEVELVVLDLQRVHRVDQAGLDFVPALAAFLAAGGGQLAISGGALDAADPDVLAFGRLDDALEWCEGELLARVGAPGSESVVEPSAHRLLEGLDAEEASSLLPRLGTVTAAPGTVVVRHEEPADELFLVTAGRLSVYAPGGPPAHRLTTLSAGMTFGELAYVRREPRSADVVADSHVECRTISFELLDELAATEPVLYGKLLRNVLAVVAGSLRLANDELALLTA
jgi:glutaminase